MNKAERVNKKRKEDKAKFTLSKDQKAQRQNDVKEETDNLLTTCEKSFKQNQWNSFFFKKKKDRRRVISSASNCLQNSGIGMKAKM
jgi:hypothetical protein